MVAVDRSGDAVIAAMSTEPTVILLPADAAELRGLVMDLLQYVETERHRRRGEQLPTDQETAAIHKALAALDILGRNEVSGE